MSSVSTMLTMKQTVGIAKMNDMDICSVCGDEVKGDEGMINTEEHGLIHTECEPLEEE